LCASNYFLNVEKIRNKQGIFTLEIQALTNLLLNCWYFDRRVSLFPVALLNVIVVNKSVPLGQLSSFIGEVAGKQQEIPWLNFPCKPHENHRI
jgi:hypothetical protein